MGYNWKGLGVTVLAIAGIYGGIYAYNGSQPAIEVAAHGKTEGYENVEDLESASTLIVVGKKESNKKVELFEDGEGGAGGYTIANFKVQKVIKNTTGDDIQPGDVIDVFENYAEDTNAFGKQIVTNVNGYKLMNNGNRYIIFADESGSDPGEYIPLGVTFGKVPLDSSVGQAELGGEGDPKAKEVILAAKEKYQNEK